jgi:hypothetical protein
MVHRQQALFDTCKVVQCTKIKTNDNKWPGGILLFICVYQKWQCLFIWWNKYGL